MNIVFSRSYYLIWWYKLVSFGTQVFDIAYIRLRFWGKLKQGFQKKHGIEIGGPSSLFKSLGLLPIYTAASQVDVCNYDYNTIWEGELTEGFNFKPEGKVIGKQIVCDGGDLAIVADESYDFLLSSHNLEHFANPLSAVREWLRILKNNGLIILVLPDPQKTFDRLRPVTEFSHLIEDFEANVQESDKTHLQEVILKTDFAIYPKRIANTLEAFIDLCNDNYNNRCMHHHVFNFALMNDIFEYLNVKKIFQTKAQPYHLIVVGQKQGE